MALNFPDNPTNGQEYEAENGVVYTYNASIDAWTGSSAAGDNYWGEMDNGSLYPLDTNANLFVGGDTTAAPIKLDASGSITAGSSLTVGDYSNTYGLYVNDQLQMHVAGEAVGALRVYNNGNSGVETFRVEGSGSVFVGGDLSSSNPNIEMRSSDGRVTAKIYNLAALDPLP